MLPGRMTKQKALILDIVRETKCHPTADWVYQQARQHINDISLGTVYRNLNNLVSRGLIQELTYSDSSTRYDGNTINHLHFACQECRQVYDLEFGDGWDEVVSKLLAIKEAEGHSIDGCRIEFHGTCRDCKGKEEVAAN